MADYSTITYHAFDAGYAVTRDSMLIGYILRTESGWIHAEVPATSPTAHA